jgi:hypothetical protein
MTGQIMFEDELRGRLDRMERQLRRWRLGGVVGLCLAVVTVACAMAEAPTRELSVETLKIVQQDGKERLILTAKPGIPDMSFLDPAGRSRLTLDIAGDAQPVLAIAESGHEKGRLTIGIENGSPMLRLYDKDGKLRVMLGIPHEVGSLIRLLDTDGSVLRRLP